MANCHHAAACGYEDVGQCLAKASKRWRAALAPAEHMSPCSSRALRQAAGWGVPATISLGLPLRPVARPRIMPTGTAGLNKRTVALAEP